MKLLDLCMNLREANVGLQYYTSFFAIKVLIYQVNSKLVYESERSKSRITPPQIVDHEVSNYQCQERGKKDKYDSYVIVPIAVMAML